MSEKRQQAEKKIQDIKEVLESLPEAFKADMRTQLIDAMAELDKIKKEEADAEMPPAAPKPVSHMQEEPMPEQPQQPVQPPVQAAAEPESPSMNVNAALASLAALMQSNEGSGVDDKRLRDMIELVLADTKIDMRKLDEEVVKFIKQNQTFVLELPQYGNLKIQVTKDDEDIPFFFDILDDVLAGNNVYLIGEAGGGKAQPLTAKVLCEKGWKTFADIKIGDKVFGEDGKLYEVNGVFDRGVKKVYRSYMSDGAYTDTCDEHLWEIQTRTGRPRNKKIVLPLSEFMGKIKTKKGESNAFIPVPSNISFPAQNHVIHPYTMGVLLGDGSMTMDNSVSITNPSEEIFENLILPLENKLSKTNYNERCLTYRIIRNGKQSENVLIEELKQNGLQGKKSVDKFIPKKYLYDSFENRVALLQGLNDTDGYCESHHFEFSTSSMQLAEDYCELVRSLGGTAKSVKRIPVYTHNGEKREGVENYRIYPVFPDNVVPFKYSEKLKKYKPRTKYKVKRFFDKVEYLGEMPVRCISVTNPTRLYITDNYIVTHNTYSAEMVAKKLKREISIINCSQYTSPTEIVGGQTITGYRDGKLIEAWREGKVLILDEMPRLDPNTAGLFNDALAKSSHTRKPQDALINSTNPQQPPIPRNNNFALIATGNIYPNDKPPSQYAANNRQDLSLLDRFSGSVYRIEYSKKLDEKQARFQFLYDILVGNYYEYMDAVKNNRTKPEAIGLRTVIKDLSYDDKAVVSYRTIVAFRVAFEFELVRELAKLSGSSVPTKSGKTLYKAFQSFLVAFSKTSVDTIISKTGFTEKYFENKVKQCVESISKGQIVKTLVEPLAKNATDIYKRYEDLFAAETIEVKND